MLPLTEVVNQIADTFEHTILAHAHNLQVIPTEDYGWENMRWFSKQFRLAHMERFRQPKFSVLHMVIWPHVTDPAPIFGFDVIASDKLVTGLFWDLSPTVMPSEPFCDLQLSNQRERPEWGDIFSPHWVACKPDAQELVQIGQAATQVLADYLKKLGAHSTPRLHDVIKAQNHYSLQQRKNEHTTKVILRLLGDSRGEEFIHQVLFPVIS
jgi:hypothetical protein